MTEFEYKTIVIDSKETEHSEKALPDKLNHYGKGGWNPFPVKILCIIGRHQRYQQRCTAKGKQE